MLPPPLQSPARSQRGAYTYRTLTFSAATGVLACGAGDHAAMRLAAPPLPDYDAGGAVIDRIVVLGLEGGPAGWSASLEGSGQQLAAAPGPLYNRPGVPDAALVVRKAGLPVAGDWAVRFRREAGGAGSVS